MRYAGFWRRFMALLFDALILMVLWYVFSVLYALAANAVWTRTVFSPDGDALHRMMGRIALGRQLLFYALLFVYFVWAEATTRGASPGKRLMGLRVSRRNGARTGLLRSAFRTVFKPLSAAPALIGFLLAGMTHRKQALHDLLSGCVVLRA